MNNYASDSPVEIEILCEKAVLRLAGKLIVQYADGTTEEAEETDRATGEKAYWGCSHKYLIQDFNRAIREGRPFALTGEQGITAIRMIDAIYRSSRTGMYVSL